MDGREPYHHMAVEVRVTTSAVIGHRLESPPLGDMLKITEKTPVGARHVDTEATLWLGNQDDPASVVIVCDRLIEALTEIRDHNAAKVTVAA